MVRWRGGVVNPSIKPAHLKRGRRRDAEDARERNYHAQGDGHVVPYLALAAPQVQAEQDRRGEAREREDIDNIVSGHWTNLPSVPLGFSLRRCHKYKGRYRVLQA